MHRYLSSALMLSLLSLPVTADAGWFLDVETGMAFPGYNDVQVPNDETGTRFSLTGALDVDPEFIYRVRAGLRTGKHTFYAFAAPLRLEGSGILEQDVDFGGETFSQGQDVTGLYRFDSYRLTWRWLLVDNPGFSFSGGLTAKIRDAEIRLESGNLSASTTNTGFVPLLSFALRWKPHRRLGLLLEGDALVGPQGRAEDVFLGVFYSASDRIELRTGYRIVEGGADVESVYNFTMVNFVTAGMTYRI
ncbi:MAG: hypothetical protein JXA64_10155 [Candidatus Fermentibacteraceae bacterium]|nr:hypothetical protein [Candidatus Fermentibacteraceae bacterium]